PGPAGTPGPTGTTGTTGAAPAMQIDPAIRAKLVEFRTHLKEFEKAASSARPTEAAPASGAMPPSAATDATSNPANPATAASGAMGKPSASPPPAPTGTTGTEPNVNAAAQSELDAIDAILKKSKTGALTAAQTAELRRHVEALRALL